MIIQNNGYFVTIKPKSRLKQKILNWLFPPQTEKVKLDTEQISNKKFIFMVTIATFIILLMEVIT